MFLAYLEVFGGKLIALSHLDFIKPFPFFAGFGFSLSHLFPFSWAAVSVETGAAAEFYTIWFFVPPERAKP